MKNVNRFNRHNLEQQMKVKGINLVDTEPWLKDFLHTKIVENVNYIKTIHEDYFARIENAVRDGVKQGRTIRHIREHLEEEVGISKNKAQFIAVDQAGTILGKEAVISTAKAEFKGDGKSDDYINAFFDATVEQVQSNGFSSTGTNSAYTGDAGGNKDLEELKNKRLNMRS